ncbi:MAG: NADH-quinone oxidoreductase subunit NuoB [Nitrososphaeria archaeon]|nr:NADH-quinone oxidoreductase subunit NuoB [Nitrososphaeria archaeon]
MALDQFSFLKRLPKKTGVFGYVLADSENIIRTVVEEVVPEEEREEAIREYGIGKPLKIMRNGETHYILQVVKNNFLVRYLVEWGRMASLWPTHLTTACCSVEFGAVSSSRYDPERFGWIPATGTLRQSDVLLIEGTVCSKMAQRVRMIYDQMPSPKWVVAMGACAISGGLYAKDSYNVLQGISDIIPVDVYVPGCPPRPETLFQGLLLLRDKILKSRLE